MTTFNLVDPDDKYGNIWLRSELATDGGVPHIRVEDELIPDAVVAAVGERLRHPTTLDRYRAGELPYAHLRDLEVGDAFRFYADDLLDSHVVYRLAEKGTGRCMIDRGASSETRTIAGRDRRGQLVERVITVRVSGLGPCAGGAQVVPL